MQTQTAKILRTETEVAVLQVQLKHVEDTVDEIKLDLRSSNILINQNHEETHKMIDTMRNEIIAEIKLIGEGLGKRVVALEKWRWSLIGAGIVLGALGINAVEKLLK